MKSVGSIRLTACAVSLAAAMASYTACAQTFEPEHTELELNALLAYMTLNEIESEILQTKAAIESDPNRASLYFKLAKLYWANHEILKAEEALWEARDRRLSERQWMVPLGRIYLERRAHDRLLAELKPPSDWVQDDQWAQDVYTLRGHAFMELGRVEQAQQAYERVLKVNPEHAEAWYGMARVHLANRQFDPMRFALNKARDFDIEDAAALVQLEASYFFETRTIEEGYEHFYLMRDDDTLQAQGLMGMTQLSLLANDHTTFHQAAAALYTLVPDHPKVMYYQAVSRYLEGELHRAESLLNALIDQYPSQAWAHFLLAKIYYQHDNMTLAHAILQKLRAYQPHNPALMGVLALVSLEVNQPAQALELMAPLRAQFPNDPRWLALEGAAHAMKGHYDEALAVYEEAARVWQSQSQSWSLAFDSEFQHFDELLGIDNALPISPKLVSTQWLEALYQRLEGDWAGAEDTIRQVRVGRAEDPLVAYVYGDVLMKQRLPHQAASYLSEAVQLAPDFVQARTALAESYLATGDMGQAEAELMAGMKKAPKDARLLMQYAELAAARHEPTQTVEWLKKAMKAAPDSAEPGLALVAYYGREGRTRDAFELAKALSGQFPDQLAFRQHVARFALDLEDYRTAESAYLGLTQEFPGSTNFAYGLASAYWGQHKVANAQALLDAILAEDSRFLPAKKLLVEVKVAQGEFDGAIEEAKSLLKETPNQWGLYQTIGQAYQALKEPDMALKYFQSFHERADTLASAQQVFEMQSAMSDPNAVATLQSWVDAHPEHPKGRHVLAEAYVRDGKRLEGIMTYERILLDDHDDLMALNNLALLYLSYDTRRAVDFATRAYQLGESHPEVLDTYGWVLLQAGQPNDAFQYLREAAKAEPNNVRIRYHLGVAKHTLGDLNGAKDELNFVIKSSKEGESLAKAKALLQRLTQEPTRDAGIRL